MEIEAFNLSKFFLKRFKQYTFKTYRLNNVKNSKWWPHFLRVVEKHINKPEWNAERFVNFVFDEYGLIYPPQLKKQEYWDEYLNKFRVKEYQTEVKIAKEILNSYKYIKRWGSKNNSKNSIEDFFNNPKTITLLERKIISPYFLCICKPFLKMYANLTEEQRNSIISKKELKLKRVVLFSYRKVKDKMKEVLKENFI